MEKVSDKCRENVQRNNSENVDKSIIMRNWR